MWRISKVLGLSAGLAVSAMPAVTAGDKGNPIDYDRARLERRLVAQRCSGPMTTDGVLDEPDWQHAPVATNFIQSDPREGDPATYDTEVRVLYNDENLYLAVTAFDDEPDKLVINDLTRDFSARSGDAFAVVLDTFHDMRNGYIFETNPMGAKLDAQFFNEGREFNLDWDGVWHVATRITEVSWTAELAIPFK
ncbi:MAG: carbohydrate binding family 9 domain-containing protein, partial [Acidobacteriota bacterium]